MCRRNRDRDVFTGHHCQDLGGRVCCSIQPAAYLGKSPSRQHLAVQTTARNFIRTHPYRSSRYWYQERVGRDLIHACVLLCRPVTASMLELWHTHHRASLLGSLMAPSYQVNPQHIIPSLCSTSVTNLLQLAETLSSGNCHLCEVLQCISGSSRSCK